MRRANEDSQESACHTIRDAFRCFIHGPARLNTDIGTIMATYVQNARNILNDDTPDFMGGRPSSVPFILPCLLLALIFCRVFAKAAKRRPNVYCTAGEITHTHAWEIIGDSVTGGGGVCARCVCVWAGGVQWVNASVG